MKFMRKKDQELEDLLEKSRQLQVELNEAAAKAAKGLVWRRLVPVGSPIRLPSFTRSSGDPAGTNRRQTNRKKGPGFG